jgi:hypothetical protein
VVILVHPESFWQENFLAHWYLPWQTRQVLWFCGCKVEVEKVLPKALFPPKNRASVGLQESERESLKLDPFVLGEEVEEVIDQELVEHYL